MAPEASNTIEKGVAIDDAMRKKNMYLILNNHHAHIAYSLWRMAS